MNDRLESIWFRKQLTEQLDKRLETASGNLAKFLRIIKREIDHQGVTLTFCASFSKNGDSLSQWRAYAEDASGVCIGFDREYFNKFCIEHSNNPRLVDVVYGFDAAEYLNDYLEHNPIDEEMSDSKVRWIANIRDSYNLWRAAPIHKNPAFSEEQEVRLVYEEHAAHGKLIPNAPMCEIDFFESNGKLIPFYSVPLEQGDKHPIREIVIGPKNKIPENGLSIRMLLEANGFPIEEHQIRMSKASYR